MPPAPSSCTEREFALVSRARLGEEEIALGSGNQGLIDFQ